jgi:hypothetical protein
MTRAAHASLADLTFSQVRISYVYYCGKAAGSPSGFHQVCPVLQSDRSRKLYAKCQCWLVEAFFLISCPTLL